MSEEYCKLCDRRDFLNDEQDKVGAIEMKKRKIYNMDREVSYRCWCKQHIRCKGRTCKCPCHEKNFVRNQNE